MSERGSAILRSGDDLDEAFRRTRLPQSAFARYAGIRRSAITKTLSHGRALKIGEAEAAAAFFSVVPPGADGDTLGAIGRLRSPGVRARAAAALAAFAGSQVDPAVGRLLSRGGEVQADQIVALSRSEHIDLVALVRLARVHVVEPSPEREGAVFGHVDEDARAWAREAQAPAPYRLAGAAPGAGMGGGMAAATPGGEGRPLADVALAAAMAPPAAAITTGAAVLHGSASGGGAAAPPAPEAPGSPPSPAPPSGAAAPAALEPFAVWLAPVRGFSGPIGWRSVRVEGERLPARLRPNDLLLLGEPDEPVERGQYAAVYLAGRHDGERALIGEVLAVSGEGLVLRVGDTRQDVEVPRAAIRAVHRVLALML